MLRLITTGDDARCLSTDLIEICRPEGLGDIANLGLALPEAKQLLARVQRAVVSGQADSDLPPFWWTRVTAYAAAASCSFCIGVM